VDSYVHNSFRADFSRYSEFLTATNRNNMEPITGARPFVVEEQITGKHKLSSRPRKAGIILALLFGVLLGAAAVYAYTSTAIVSSYLLKPGLYELKGHNPTSGAAYEGQVLIAKEEDTEGDTGPWYVRWLIGENQQQAGIGVLSNNVLSVSYADVSGGTVNDVGVVSYRIVGFGKLEGTWLSQGSVSGGVEKLRRIGDLPTTEETQD